MYQISNPLILASYFHRAVIALQFTPKQLFITIRTASCEKLNEAIHKTKNEFCPPFYQKNHFLIACHTMSPLFWVSSSHAAQTLSKLAITMPMGQIPAVCGFQLYVPHGQMWTFACPLLHVHDFLRTYPPNALATQLRWDN